MLWRMAYAVDTKHVISSTLRGNKRWVYNEEKNAISSIQRGNKCIFFYIIYSAQRGNKHIFFYMEGKLTLLILGRGETNVFSSTRRGKTVSSAMRGHRRNDIESYLVLQGNFTRTNELENTYK